MSQKVKVCHKTKITLPRVGAKKGILNPVLRSKTSSMQHQRSAKQAIPAELRGFKL
jgi:hypothetical protein